LLAATLFSCAKVWSGDIVNPSEDQLAKGEELVLAVKKIFEMDSLNPKNLQEKLGFEMQMTEKAKSKDIERLTNYSFFVEKSFPYLAPCKYYYCYQIRQGDQVANGIQIRLRINEKDVCLSPSKMISILGKPQEVSTSTMRHYARGQEPLPNILPYELYQNYVTKTGIKLSISFDYYSCASGISIEEPHTPNWIFSEENPTEAKVQVE
jgi:hypothetical protein